MTGSLTDAKRRLLVALKRAGETTAPTLGGELGLTNAAVRQHLEALEREGLVSQSPATPTEDAGRGRPPAMWRLTSESDRFFPDSHAELTVGFINAAKEAFGAEGLMRIVEVRARDQANLYGSLLPGKGASLRERVNALAEQRSREGYMAEVVQERPGVFLLIEHHCPICDAAKTCQGLCAHELEVFQKTIGDGADVERTEHLLSGDMRCAYRISSRPD